MRIAVVCVLATYLCILIIWSYGSATHWDGQGAILILPIILLGWVLSVISIVLLALTAKENVKNGIMVALLCVPVWVIAYIVYR